MRRLKYGLLVLGLLTSQGVEAAGVPNHSLPAERYSPPISLYQQVNVSPPQHSMFWLVVSSRPSYGEASAIAQQFSMTLGPTAIIQSNNGLYAIVAGTLYKDKAKQNLATLKALQLIPDDAFLSAGTNFYQVVSHTYGERPMTDLMTQPAYRGTVRRMQSVFRQMDIYRGPSDGLIGPATVKSFNAYKSVYPGPSSDHLVSADISSMESNARDGFRSQAERLAAIEGGFSDAAEYRRARSAGFSSSYEFTTAQRAGLSSQAEYVAFQSSGFPDPYAFREARAGGFNSKALYDEASSAGFKSKVDFDNARAAGFRSANDFNEARRLGIDSHGEYLVFKSSGFSDPVEFRKARAGGIVTKAAWDQKVAAELTVARENATALLTDAETFLKLNPSAPNLIGIADTAAALSATLRQAAAEAVQQASAKLTETLGSVPGWTAFADKRAKERADEIAALKLETKKQLTIRQSQLTRWVAANITSAQLPEVVGELKLLGDALGSEDLRTLASARSSIEAVIVRLNLKTSLETPVSQESRNSGGATTQISAEVTPQNRELLIGSLNEEVILLNSGATAPSLLRTLNGSYSFTTGVATVCVLGIEITPSLQRGLLDALAPLGASGLVFASNCSQNSIQAVDLLIMQRKSFLESETTTTTPILDAVSRGGLKVFRDVDFAKVRAKQDEEDKTSAEIAKGIEDGTRRGYGALLLPVPDGAFCLVTDSKPALHDKFIEQVGAFDPSEGLGTVLDGTLDEVYQEMRRNKCRVLYGSAQSLKQVTEAYSRDGLKYDFLPLWFDAPTVDREVDAAAARELEHIKASEAERLASQEEAQAADRRRREEREQRSVKQTKLRKDNVAGATAAMNAFVDGIKLIVLKEQAGVGSDQAAKALQVGALFPSLANWVERSLEDDWRPMKADTSVSDYGKVTWKGRSLEAVVVEARIRSSSRERGEYQDHCVLLGAVIDREFETVRDPIEAVCNGDEDALTQWKVGHSLDSLWTVQ